MKLGPALGVQRITLVGDCMVILTRFSSVGCLSAARLPVAKKGLMLDGKNTAWPFAIGTGNTSTVMGN